MVTTQLALEELQKVIDLFGSKELPNLCAKALINSPGRPSSRWSFGNQLLMMLMGTEDARGFRQWHEVGRYVRKGSHAFYILGPVVVKNYCRTCWSSKCLEPAHHHEDAVLGFKAIPVFRLEDTEGKPLEEYKPRELPPLHQVAERWGIKTTYEVQRGEYGHYDMGGNSITLGTEDWSVFFHELAHAAHARMEKLRGGQDVDQEAVAELTAATLTRIYGKSNDEFSWNYIAHYAGGKTPEQVGRLCIKVLSKVQKVLLMLLDEAETQPEEAPITISVGSP